MQALVSAGLLFGATKTYGTLQGFDVPLDVYGMHAGFMGASKIVADIAIPDTVGRALIAGALFSGMAYLFYKDKNYPMNLALGATSSYVADVVLHQAKKREED